MGIEMKELILQYVKYNLWANKRIADLLGTTEPSLLDKEITSSFPSIRKTVHHIWDAELAWIARLQEKVISWPPSAQFIDPAIDHFLKTSEEFISLVEAKNDAYLKNSTTYKDSRGNTYTNVNYGIIMHCMNHSTFHRGQLITMMREAGITKFPSTDLITYLREIK
jgi:uncharacterized damage-inducible protein DinB